MNEVNNLTFKFNSDSQVLKKNIVYLFLKRTIDILGSIAGLILFSPIFIIIAIAIKLEDKGPAIFSHKRLGMNGKYIKIYKFRSMFCDAEKMLESLSPEQKKEFQENFKLENDPRITKLGKKLRKTSLDELPQFLNVLKGELTLVGPRPIIEIELEKYGEFAAKFLSVKPGLTGLWQVSGRSDTTYEERVKMDMDYIDNRTIIGDVIIILKTVTTVISKEGAK
ncbi:sugar transferase [Clostridium grantii]|uniref:Sugar transferase involved in LPS biosynthesis (Colanic, teichoic acid) n=1 Tax=Clostridium grantii DSM 8605 TaxID=1121316 RepID=A0A1M5RLG1_9CLOT|nr:sugar transferase [Clostridium grantii]SHH27162.1 Sugar transferase involved in LPS biosynthesis (colanic, teichoic acid) [Clostridium grantii DSM 8605]